MLPGMHSRKRPDTASIAAIAFGMVVAFSLGCDGDKSSKTKPGDVTKPGDTTTPTAVTPEPDEPAADKPAASAQPATKCPGAKELPAWLAKAWKVGDKQTVDTAKCGSGRFPESGFAITAWIIPEDGDGPPEAFDYRMQILSADGKVLADYADPDADDPRMWLNGSSSAIQASDLDGDGTDEILESSDLIRREDSESSWVTVYQRSGEKLAQVGSVESRRRDSQMAKGGDPDDPENPHAIDCKSVVSVSEPDAGGKRAIKLVWTAKEGAKAKGSCPTDAAYMLKDGKLVTQ